MIPKSFYASFSSFPLPLFKVCPSRSLSIPSCQRNFWQISYIKKGRGISPMTHPITWGPPLCRLQTNPDQLNPLMYCALLDSWGKHVDQLKLRRKWHPAKSSLGQDPILNFANLSIFFNYKFDSVHLLHARLTFPKHRNEDCRSQLKTWPRTWTLVATWQPWCQALHEEWVGAKAGTQDKEYKCCCNHQQYRKRLCRVVIDAFIWPLQLLQSSCISTEEKY